MEENLFVCPLSLEALRGDPAILARIRREIIGEIASREFECVSLVEASTGNSIVLCCQSREDAPSHIGSEFSYDTHIVAYLETRCVDTDPSAIVDSLTRERIAEALKQHPDYTVYFNISSDDGRILHKQASAHRISFMDGFFCLCVIDLTNAFIREDLYNSQLEKALKEIQANLDANNTFLTLISRDIRTPLHSIIGLTRIANAQLKDISAVESYLHKISMSGTYMEETINDIRDYIRISWHPIELRAEQIDLPKFMGFTKQVFERQAKERELHFLCHTEGLKVTKVWTDPAALRQVFIKLTGNIMNYTLRGGTIDLKLDSEYLENDQVRLTVNIQSRGMDLDQDRLKVLLESYEYVMNEVHSNLNSIDMDLVILKAYLHAMGGEIKIDSQKGIRTGLTLILDLDADGTEKKESGTPASRMAIPATAALPSFKGRTALLADDDVINLEVGTKILESAGMTVYNARNGAEAVNIFTAENGHFDLILMDIRMPIMNGLEATRRIRNLSLPTAATVPIIALTVNAFEEDIELSLKAGMNEHLIKPIEPSQLYHVLSELLEPLEE